MTSHSPLDIKSPNLLDGRIDKEALDNYTAFEDEVRRIEKDLDDTLWKRFSQLAAKEPERDDKILMEPGSLPKKSVFLRDRFRNGSDRYDTNVMYDRLNCPTAAGDMNNRISTSKSVRKRRVETTCVTRPEEGAAAYEIEWSNRINLGSPNGRTEPSTDDNRMLDFVKTELSTDPDDVSGEYRAILRLKLRLLDKYKASEISIRARGPGNKIIVQGRHEQPLGLTDYDYVSDEGNLAADELAEGGELAKVKDLGTLFYREFSREFILPLSVSAKEIRASMVGKDLVLEIPIPFKRHRSSPVKEVPIIYE